MQKKNAAVLDPPKNPLGTEKVGKLILKFAIPAIISFLVNSLYNIVDQIFIGQGVGMYGNAATNVAFPITITSTAIALLLGIGSASNFNLKLGEGHKEQAGHFAGTGIFLLAVFGSALGISVLLFQKPLLFALGTTKNVLPYALEYTSIVAIGLPFITFSIGAGQLIRADGSPGYSMICVLSGAILNTLLDPLFIFVFRMGMAGAAWATVIGQLVSVSLTIGYFFRFKAVKLARKYFKPEAKNIRAILALGSAPFFNQVAMAAVQITMNNSLAYYGAMSQYGADIPLACVGVITKVNILFLGFTIGIAQGCQPINGFNYGQKNSSVKEDIYKGYICGNRNFNRCLSGFSNLSKGDCQCFRSGERDVFQVCGALFPHIYAAYLRQRNTSGNRELFYFHRQGQSRLDDYLNPSNTVSSASDTYFPCFFWYRRHHVCRPDR